MQTSQTVGVMPGGSGKLSTVTFHVRILPLEVRCLLQDMQELSGATQMTLLIILPTVAPNFPFHILSRPTCFRTLVT